MRFPGGENSVESCHISGCHGFSGPDVVHVAAPAPSQCSVAGGDSVPFQLKAFLSWR